MKPKTAKAGKAKVNVKTKALNQKERGIIEEMEKELLRTQMLADFFDRNKAARMSARESIKRNWIVRVKCIVQKDVIADNCTEEEARNNPFAFASSELEILMSDWEVIEINKI